MCNSAVINAESTSLFNIGTVFRTKKWDKDNVIVWFLDVKESTWDKFWYAWMCLYGYILMCNVFCFSSFSPRWKYDRTKHQQE